jgi:hypothetical protein
MHRRRGDVFKEAVRRYFAEKLGQEVGEVTFEYDEGYHYSSYTYEDPSFKIVVYDIYGKYVDEYRDTTTGEFLTELFAWETAA